MLCRTVIHNIMQFKLTQTHKKRKKKKDFTRHFVITRVHHDFIPLKNP